MAFVDVASGLTLNRRPMCPIHAFAAAARAFVDMERPGLDPLTVILAPL